MTKRKRSELLEAAMDNPSEQGETVRLFIYLFIYLQDESFYIYKFTVLTLYYH